MKINVEELINSVRKYPMIYNPDHKDFSNQKVREYVFDTLISKDMKGIKGQKLHQKWTQVLNTYANFIRKLSMDDSSESVLTAFMNWPWTRHMRIFKPYVRKQFKIPEFQSAIQIEDIVDIPPDMGVPNFQPQIQMPRFQPDVEMSFMSTPSTSYGNHDIPFQSIALMMGLGRDSEQDPYADNNTDADQESDQESDWETVAMDQSETSAGEGSSTDEDGEETETKQPAAKKSKRMKKTEVNVNDEDDVDTVDGSPEEDSRDVLPDLPQPHDTPERDGSNFTAQEHLFLAWAKTMSTFTPRRQATVKLKIHKIMSEAELEDLDDEFFGTISPPQRSIYTYHR